MFFVRFTDSAIRRGGGGQGVNPPTFHIFTQKQVHIHIFCNWWGRGGGWVHNLNCFIFNLCLSSGLLRGPKWPIRASGSASAQEELGPDQESSKYHIRGFQCTLFPRSYFINCRMCLYFFILFIYLFSLDFLVKTKNCFSMKIMHNCEMTYIWYCFELGFLFRGGGKGWWILGQGRVWDLKGYSSYIV